MPGPIPPTMPKAREPFLLTRPAQFIQNSQDAPFLLWVGFFDRTHPSTSLSSTPDCIALTISPCRKPQRKTTAGFRRSSATCRKKISEGVVSAYYNSVAYLDKNVGIVLEALQKAGLDENTLVVYLGDHGYLLGDHKRFEKHMMWEPAVRAPLIVRAGSRFAPGQRTEVLTEFVDVVPTITELLNVPPLPTAQGRSTVPALENPDTTFRDFVFSEFLVDNKAMVRDNE